jgi:hypothetical protein
MNNNTDNSGTGVILGIILAIAVAIGAYYFIKSEGGLDGTNTTNIELPDVNIAPAAGNATPSNSN